MNKNIHVANTWLWANLLHPFVMLFYFGGADINLWGDLFGTWMTFTMFFIFFSLPSLFLSWLAIYLISLGKFSPSIQYIAWLVAAPLVICINFILLLLLFAGEIGLLSGPFIEMFEIIMPSIIAVVIVILLRHQSFFKAMERLPEEAITPEQASEGE